MQSMYEEFIEKFKLLNETKKELIVNTLSNIFTMRLVGNKTHGDLAEIGISEFINQFMDDYESKHVGKDLFRAKEHEEDIIVTNKLTKEELSISLKAYGDGPLQLSTDKNAELFPMLKKYGNCITDPAQINEIFNSSAFLAVKQLNVMPLIYQEKKNQCNILIFDFSKAMNNTAEIQLISPGGRRKHPIYAFYDANGKYICEVRYGAADANALQRGLWTHTKNAIKYFTSATDGWIDYTPNKQLIELLKLALNSTSTGHATAIKELKEDIKRAQASGKV